MEVTLSNTMRKALFILSCISLAVGSCGGPLLMRLYFVKGGTRLWLSSCLQTVGFPMTLIPLFFLYLERRKTNGPNTNFITMKLPIFISTAFIGIISAAVCYFFGYGVQRLPVSTASLILSTQLVFTAFFAFIIVRQKFTAYTINAVLLLTLGAVVLALHTSSDRPQGESKKMYGLGFLMTVAAAVLSGLMFPLIELVYKKAKQAVTCSLVLEIQMMICISSTVFATVGMLVADDFKKIPHEAREFQLGEVRYYVVLVANAIVWQFSTLGAVGIIFCASSLVTGIVGAVLLPIQQVLAVIIFHDEFKAEKGISLILCLWGFVSHLYGDYKDGKKKEKEKMNMKQVKELEMNSDALP